MNITGLSQFDVEHLVVDLKQKTGSVKLNIPKIQGGADYEINAMVMGFIPIEGNGPVTLSVENIGLNFARFL